MTFSAHISFFQCCLLSNYENDSSEADDYRTGPALSRSVVVRREAVHRRSGGFCFVSPCCGTGALFSHQAGVFAGNADSRRLISVQCFLPIPAKHISDVWCS